ncbi:MAG: hypothetical protein K6G64_01485 [Eubacterium sp.]|nr:hypothetical protein [Eubacterium sp.]
MLEKKNSYISEWKSFSELRRIQNDISEWGYKKEFINNHCLEEKMKTRWCDMKSGVENFIEPIEVKIQKGELLWRYNEKKSHLKVPKLFETQLGIFNNHNNGEFTSWLDKNDCKTFFVEGNYCDMFDCGEYVYAVSNMMHAAIGRLKVIRIDKSLNIVEMFENNRNDCYGRLKYLGSISDNEGYWLLVSGFREENDDKKSEFMHFTILIQIAKDGTFEIKREWRTSISNANSVVKIGECIYLGNNKMITRLNIITGEMAFFTDKTEKEMAALAKLY